MVPTSGSNKTRTVCVLPSGSATGSPPHHSSVSVVRGAHPATSLSRTERQSPRPPNTHTLNTVGVSKLNITFQCEYINSHSLLC